MDADNRDLDIETDADLTEEDDELLLEETDEEIEEEAIEEPAIEAEANGAKVAPSVKPSLFSRAVAAITAPFERIRWPRWDLRLFGWGLLALVIIAFFAMNWTPMRLFFFGLSVDLPRALAIVLLLAIGFIVGWLSRTPAPVEEEEEE